MSICRNNCSVSRVSERGSCRNPVPYVKQKSRSERVGYAVESVNAYRMRGNGRMRTPFRVTWTCPGVRNAGMVECKLSNAYCKKRALLRSLFKWEL